ncbi:MAG: heparinase II/III family protein, partial [Candidatus Latescibacteria bacterium]|nr:heparinase II/III family protein [Candidatus Latescibacterota bacterium]
MDLISHPGTLLLPASFCAVLMVLALVRRGWCNDVDHPVYPVEASADRITRLEGAVAPLMALSEDRMVDLVPDRTGFRFMGCPNCDEGTQEGQLSWSIEDPDRVQCRYCGVRLPNETYPEDGTMRVRNPLGDEVVYPYWEEETGYRYLFSAKGWREARVTLSGRCQDLGALYQMTGERAYARRAVLILDAFARYYPGFLVSNDRAFQQKGFFLEPPYPNHGGKWGRWRADEIPTNLVYAYDSVHTSGELERLAEETGVDVKSRIEEDLFRGAIRQDGFHGPQYGNASPRIYHGYAVIGRVIGDPSLVHEAVRRSKGLFERRFYADGFWCEGSVGYHRMTMGGMQTTLDVLRGHSDPPGYADPVDGTRFDDLDVEKEIAVIGKARQILEICRYPDGRRITVHDCRGDFQDLAVPERSAPALFTGVGHAWLGCGEGENQVQAHLHFSGAHGHAHADNLNLTLFAKGHELLSDLGYTHTRYRKWTTSTLAHNTVLIDERGQYVERDQDPTEGRLLAFETAVGTVQWVEASAERVYPGVAKEYRRTVALIPAREGDAYVVDLFRVEGGTQHDWVIHGNADADGSGEADVSLEPFGDHMLPGAAVRYPAHERDEGEAEGRDSSYMFFQNVSRAEARNGVRVGFGIENAGVGVRAHLPTLSDAEVFLGDAPSLRRCWENDALVDQYRMPIFLARRRGEHPLRSCFAAVHEPYGKDPFLERVTADVVSEDEDHVCVSVSYGGVTDILIHTGASSAGEASIGGMWLRG